MKYKWSVLDFNLIIMYKFTFDIKKSNVIDKKKIKKEEKRNNQKFFFHNL